MSTLNVEKCTSSTCPTEAYHEEAVGAAAVHHHRRPHATPLLVTGPRRVVRLVHVYGNVSRVRAAHSTRPGTVLVVYVVQRAWVAGTREEVAGKQRSSSLCPWEDVGNVCLSESIHMVTVAHRRGIQRFRLLVAAHMPQVLRRDAVDSLCSQRPSGESPSCPQ